jgi:hypothetical protein
MEFRLTVTIAEHGRDPSNGNRFLGGFVKTHPETGAVVDQNTETGELSVTFAFDAQDLLDAMRIGPTIFVEGTTASGLPATKVTDYGLAADFRITAVETETEDDAIRELAPVA